MTDKILLAHGSGGKLAREIIQNSFLPALSNSILNKLDDAAVIEPGGRLAFTTDSYVVQPIFFPGGDIGKLAVCGTVNDLAMVGATPQYLSLSFIIEEGLPINELERVVNSVKETAQAAGVEIVAGDTKVVNRGGADKLFLNTAGLGTIPPGANISGHNARPGDVVILSGTIGDHGIAVLSQREGLDFATKLQSDCAPLNKLVAEMLEVSLDIHCLRDPTRGGLASTLNEVAEQSGVSIRIEEEKIPVREEVLSACEMLGLDPLYIANEGKLMATVDPKDAEAVLAQMQKNEYGRNAAIIGEIKEGNPGRVVMRTRLGTSRIIDMLVGEPLPRIC
ncbi:MAG TPA: hydrogenase expression/formation protein HypE [Dehalococcoidia bacterium]|jgi:hydrogenase expression/formation protein HypE|nr:hydrogenase expression/formation protein HypE [Dehalococcoidia bacterium]